MPFKSTRFEKRVRRANSCFRMLRHGDKILVPVSDSVESKACFFVLGKLVKEFGGMSLLQVKASEKNLEKKAKEFHANKIVLPLSRDSLALLFLQTLVEGKRFEKNFFSENVFFPLAFVSSADAVSFCKANGVKTIGVKRLSKKEKVLEKLLDEAEEIHSGSKQNLVNNVLSLNGKLFA